MKKKNREQDALLILIFLAGLSLLLYPAVSNFWNQRHQSGTIHDYTQAVDSGNEEQNRALLEAAQRYNRDLLNRTKSFEEDPAWREEYLSQLDVTGNGVMGYVDIPGIGCTLPIYHGTEEDVLQVAIGHLEWSSLPVGGENTHCVVSGHRGLPSAELLTNIDRMQLGDVFYLHVLGQVLEYRVDDISVVLPEDTSRLGVMAGRDLVTLVTCTPYGVNSHRLLVRGTRVDRAVQGEQERVLWLSNEIRPVELTYVLPIVLVVFGFAMAVCFYLARVLDPPPGKRQKPRGKKHNGE